MDYTPVTLYDLFACGIQKSCIEQVKHNKRCGNPISKEGIKMAKHILNAIDSGASVTYVLMEMENLASLCLCKSRHQDEKEKIADKWKTQYLAWRRHQMGPTGLHDILLHNEAGGSTAADEIKTEMCTEWDRHQQEFHDTKQRCEQVTSLRKQSQPDVIMQDVF